MARIIYSALVESIRGSIAGTTFQKNKHGYTIKKKPNMINPNTALQSNRKKTFSQVTRSWRDLTQSQRDAYDTFASNFPQYAKHNPSSQLSGFSVFTKFNSYRLLTGSSILTAAGSSVPAADTLSYEVENNAGTLSVNITSSLESEDWKLIFFMSRPISATKKFVGTAPKYVGFGYNATTGYDITTAYTNIFGGVPGVGDLVALDVVPISELSAYVLARDSDIYTVVSGA